MQYHNYAITNGVSSTAKWQSNLAKVNKSILGSYLQHEASIKMNWGGGCLVSDHFGTAGTALHIMQTHYYAQCTCILHYIAQCTWCLQNNTLLSAMYSANFAGCCNALLCAIYALQVCIATCANTSRTSSGSLHCIIHRGARIITMHNAPSTTSNKQNTSSPRTTFSTNLNEYISMEIVSRPSP